MKGVLRFAALTLFTLNALGCSLSNSNFLRSPTSATAERSSIADRRLAMARLSERHGQSAQAARIYENIISKEPNDPIAHHRLGIIAAKNGEFDKAIQHFQVAERVGPPSAELLGDMGYALYLQHQLDQAESKLRQALKVDPNDKRSQTNLGLVLGEQGRFEESFAQFCQSGDDSTAYTNLAFIQAQMGHLKEAEANYHKALSLDSNNRNAAEALIQVAARTGGLQKPAPLAPRHRTTETPESAVAAAQHQPRPETASSNTGVIQASVNEPTRQPTPQNAAGRAEYPTTPAGFQFPGSFDNQAFGTLHQPPITANRDQVRHAVRPADWTMAQPSFTGPPPVPGTSPTDVYHRGMQAPNANGAMRISDLRN